ncbi:h domain protein [Nocardia caishijiensis]|uniref:Mce-associated membrane protein n=1 Tax=Nocardia caishijiensis TaxID=184756 RepID=A0ABQ6YR77_9NOCA|nr:h domain protein [Nocardia caishijiensis]KAF0847951.1 Mce-associated membrane protein [Nocardia caishijiensis]
MSRTSAQIFCGILAVFGLLAAAVLGISSYQMWQHDRTEQARSDAMSTASRTVSAMFSYEAATVDTELPKAADGLSESFRNDYLRLIEEAIAPGAKEKQLTVKATTQAEGVISAEPEHAVVLLYLNQVTTSKDTPQGTASGSRVRVALDKTGDRWLVSQVTPV